ncbi:MAG: ShlB/FhaC/HecB family hemolysin secretion/activation protein [Candidatus Omnitrophica bacterium]|nr:ShlB/FhaC/HecB family hemolysin secretion/activation protein [Candidatus Omnitrophota bacterium]
MKFYGQFSFYFLKFLAVFFFVVYCGIPAFAQSNVQEDKLVPPGQEAASLEKQFREETEEKTVPKQPKLEMEKEPVPEEPLPEKEIYFQVDKINVSGNTVISTEKIGKVLKPYEGRRLNLYLLREAAGKITALYRLQGYVTSRAYVPHQRIKNKTAQINVLEGKIGKVSVERERYFSAGWIRSQAGLRPGEVLNYKRLEKNLTRLNQHRDIEVKTVLTKGERPETSNNN